MEATTHTEVSTLTPAAKVFRRSSDHYYRWTEEAARQLATELQWRAYHYIYVRIGKRASGYIICEDLTVAKKYCGGAKITELK